MEAAPHNLDYAAGPVSPFSEEALNICFATLCIRGGREGDIRLLLRARVSRRLRNGVHVSLPLVPRITFPAHVTGADVLAMLMRVAGANLKTVCLEGCRQLSAVDIGRILADLAARCPAVIEVNLTDCGEEAILRVLATAAKRQFGAVSPADLHAMLLALAEGEAASRCPLELLLGQITSPALRVADEGQGFVPGRDAFRKAVQCAIGDSGEEEEEEEETNEMEEEGVKASVYDEEAVYVVALLMACDFSAGPDEETITFHCNQRIEDDYYDEEEDDEPGKRALHLMAEGGGPLALLFLLLVAGARVDAQNDNQQTPLHVSAAKGSEAACRVLIEHRANVNAQDQNKCTPLHYAALFGHTSTVDTLIQGRADVNAVDSDKSTPLHWAAKYGRTSTVDTLIQGRADVNAVDWPWQNTPLHYAASSGHTSTVDTLIQGRADVNAVDVDERTPLHKAAERGHTSTVDTLIQGRADVNAVGRAKWTPLHSAALFGRTSTVDTLIQGRADVNAVRSGGDTPLDDAKSQGHTEVARLLEAAGGRGKR